MTQAPGRAAGLRRFGGRDGRGKRGGAVLPPDATVRFAAEGDLGYAVPSSG